MVQLHIQERTNLLQNKWGKIEIGIGRKLNWRKTIRKNKDDACVPCVVCWTNFAEDLVKICGCSRKLVLYSNTTVNNKTLMMIIAVQQRQNNKIMNIFKLEHKYSNSTQDLKNEILMWRQRVQRDI